jgi:Helix-turn-helix
VLSRLDDRIRAMKSWRYWSLIGMLAAVIIGALVVITSRVLVGPIGPVRPIGPTGAAGSATGSHMGVVDRLHSRDILSGRRRLSCQLGLLLSAAEPAVRTRPSRTRRLARPRRPRTLLGLSQVELAARVGMTQPALSRVEAGGVISTIPLRDRISAVWTPTSSSRSRRTLHRSADLP